MIRSPIVLSLVLAALTSLASTGLAATPPPDPGTSAAADGGYLATDLGTLGGEASVANAINELGQVAGWSMTVPGQEVLGPGTRAFLWSDWRMVDLGTLGGDYSAAGDINDAGQVVGWAETGDGARHAFLWEDGRMVDLGTLGGIESAANAINAAGVIVGWAEDRDGKTRAVRWDGGRIAELGTLGGDESAATDLNDAGQIVGRSTTASSSPNPLGLFGTHAVLWDEGGVTDLGTIGEGEISAANAINDAGQVVGQSTSRPGAQFGEPGAHAVVWNWGTIIDLGTRGGEISAAYAINDAGQIVGETLTVEHRTAALWEGSGVLGLSSGEDLANGALDINDAGQIVGYSTTGPDQALFDPGTHAVRWEQGPGTPRFEPRTGYPTPTPVSTAIAQVVVELELGFLYFEPETLTVPAETGVQIVLTNVGTLHLNFSVNALGISVDVAPGATKTVALHAHAGEYEFYSDLPGHKEAGMRGTLIVAGGADDGRPTAATTPGAATGSVTLEVEMVDIAFTQTELVVPAGSVVTVNLTNAGAAVHNFTIDALGVASDDYVSGETGQVTFIAPTEPGEYEYVCIQPGHEEAGMVGRLIVRN